MTLKILNLYAGIGGNARNWDNCDITSVEIDPKVAELYGELYPDDEVVVGDAHQYLLDHYDEFDFIWSSPPCQSHSRMIRSGRNRKPRYPDCRLYEEILFLQHNFEGLWVVENVRPYYEPLIEPRYMGRHAFWSNFDWDDHEEPKRDFDFINDQNLAAKDKLMKWHGIYFERNVYMHGNHCPTQILRNMVHYSTGAHIFNAALDQLQEKAQ